MNKEQSNLKQYMEERFRLRARRRRLYAVVAALSAAVALGVTAELVRPAITVTAPPQCGLEAHLHSGACFEKTLICGQEEGENHTHGEGCYATVLVCALPEHTHTESCYPQTLPEPTVPAEKQKETAPEEITAETTVPALNEDGNGSPKETAENTESPVTEAPAETAEPAVTEAPSETTEPSMTEEPAETAEPAGNETGEEQPEKEPMKIEALHGPETLQAGQKGEWRFAAANAEKLVFAITAADGSITARQELAPESVSFHYTISASGLYTVRLTAMRGEESVCEERRLAVSAGELRAAVDTGTRSCFGGDEVTFTLSSQGGVAPVTYNVSVYQGGATLLEEKDRTEKQLRVTAMRAADVTTLYVRLTATDACGATATADKAIFCAVHTAETGKDWEATLAEARLTGSWPEDLLAVARTQLGYRESTTDFIIDADGHQKGYTRYGRWYGSEYSDWCAMYVSFCLHYAGVPESAFPQEAGCGSWVRALQAHGLYRAPGEYAPQSGDIVFFDWQQNGQPDHVGILEKADSDTLTVLEGNSGNSVCRSTYLTTDGTICGYGSLNDAFGRYQQAQNNETPETPAPDAEGTESPEASAEPTPEPSETPSIEPSLEPSAEPSASPEASPEALEEPAEPEETEETPEPVPPLTAAEKLAALIDSLNEELPGDSEEANDGTENGENGAAPETSYEARWNAAWEAVQAAQNDESVSSAEFAALLEKLIERQPGGVSPAYETLRETVENLRSPAEDAGTDEKVEYRHLLDALRERLAAAEGSGELTQPEALALKIRLDNVPVCPVDCVYTALDGAVRVIHAESGALQTKELTARFYSAEEEEALRLRDELTARLALEGRGAIADLMLADIGFDAGEGGAEVTLRLDEAVAAGENLLAAHRSEDGWEWLEFERLTDEDGRQYVSFHTDSFSPFAVLSLTETDAAGADLADYAAQRGGSLSFRLTNEDGTEPEADEDGVYTVEQGVEFVLHMDISCPEGFAEGQYAVAFPEGVIPSAGEGVLAAEETEIGRWSADGESARVLLRLDEAAQSRTVFPLELRVSFRETGEVIRLGSEIAVRCYAVPDGPVAEVCVGDAWMALRDSGYFTYWSDKIKEAEAYETQAAVRSRAAAPRSTAAPSDGQVVARGGENSSEDGVKVSKTIQGTELENVFDITLTVQTPTEISTFYQEPDMAVVIVMDISNTMKSNFGDSTRYKAAMDAAEAFLDEFAEASNGVSKIGYVAFNTDAHQIFGLQPCSNGNEATNLKNQMRSKTGNIINGYEEGSRNRFTNIEAGLKMGRDMLASASNQNKYIIFLSDGFPTTYISSGYSGYDPYDGSGTRFRDRVLNKPCAYGTSYSDEAAIRARNMANSIKNEGIKIFSIGVDVGGQTVQMYVDQTNGKDFSVVDRTSTSYEIGSASSEDAYKNWLGNSIGSGYYYDSTDTNGLKAAYDQIFQEIKMIHETSASAIWVTNDQVPVLSPGTDGVEFIGLYTKNGQLVGNNLAGSNDENGENTASFDPTKSDIQWDLKKSGYRKTTDGNRTLYDYAITYRVRLKNESPDFVEGKVYETNGETKLTYQTIEEINGQKKISEVKNIVYPIPSVKGYLAEFSFLKTDRDGKPLPGAEFTLAHDKTRCQICRGDRTSVAIGDFVARSDEDGMVIFSGIPSGHQYRLTETGVPTGYLDPEDTYAVTVAYDVITVTVTHPDGTSENWDGTKLNTIVNGSRPRLPDTGGTDPLLYTFGGIALMAISLLYGCAKKRRRSRESIR
mgnify:CR=1 FL=1